MAPTLWAPVHNGYPMRRSGGSELLIPPGYVPMRLVEVNYGETKADN